jgi:hypothetical protein
MTATSRERLARLVRRSDADLAEAALRSVPAVTFVIGGMTGVLLAVPPVDYLMHNTTFLVAHFHNMLIPGAIFGYFAGYMYWFPKAFGFTLDERWGIRAFWLWLIGFWLAFMPLYVLGKELEEVYPVAFLPHIELVLIEQ